MRLLAGREHSRLELWRKLSARSYDTDLVDQVLDALVQQHLLSDERFTEQYLASRQQKGYGPVRIKEELRERGIGDELIRTFLGEQDGAWVDFLQMAHDKKFGSGAPDSMKEQARRSRFLEHRGFTGEQIRSFFQDI